jgi:glucosamine kinase
MERTDDRGTPRTTPALHRAPPWAIGIDGGGSGVRAWAARIDHDPGREPAGSYRSDAAANPYAVGVESAAAAIVTAIRGALRSTGAAEELGEAFVCVGTAGVERREEHDGITAALLAAGVAAERLTIVGDPWVALEGALPDDAGARALLLAGTGSIAVASAAGIRRRVGGWGARVGDEGGGAWLGIEAVRATLRALDGRDPLGTMAAGVRAAWGAEPDALLSRARDAAPSDFAALAPLVLRCADDDPIAAALRTRAVAALAELLTTAAAAAPHPPACALAGGIATALASDLRSVLPDALAARLQAPAGAPVSGAWRLARAAARRAGL